MISALFRFIVSLRGTAWLILALALVFLLGLWIPQKGIMEYDQYLRWKETSPTLFQFVDTLRLNEIYTSPVTFALWVLFFINLTLVTWRRLPVIRTQVALPILPLKEPEQLTAFAYHRTVALGDVPPELLLERFTSAGYEVVGEPERFHGVKYRLSPALSLLFHISFFLMLLGGLISNYTRFQGVVDLGVGETFRGELERYSEQPQLPKMGRLPENEITVVSVTPQVQGFTPTGLQVRLKDGRGVIHTADVNRPYKTNHAYYVVKDLGMAPLFVLKDADGRELDGAYTRLNVLRGKEDGFVLGANRFRTRFFPDYTEVDGKPATASEEFRNPVFRVALERNGALLPEVSLPPHGVVEVNGLWLELREVRYWVRLIVIRERGLSVLYTGFALATLALIVRLLFYRREMAGSVRTENGVAFLTVAGRSDFYKVLAGDEFDALLAKLTEPDKEAGEGGIEHGSDKGGSAQDEL